MRQFALAEDASRALGIVTWPMVEFEADDALATAAARFAAAIRASKQVVICSPDKDLAQCVRGERVVCLDRMRRKTLDERGVVAKFGVRAASIPTGSRWSATAPTAIPALPRWGAKSAAARARRYEHLEAIPDGRREHGASRCAAPPRSPQSLRRARDGGRSLPAARDAAHRRAARRALEELRWRGPDVAALAVLVDLWGDDVARGARATPGGALTRCVAEHRSTSSAGRSSITSWPQSMASVFQPLRLAIS